MMKPISKPLVDPVDRTKEFDKKMELLVRVSVQKIGTLDAAHHADLLRSLISDVRTSYRDLLHDLGMLK